MIFFCSTLIRCLIYAYISNDIPFVTYGAQARSRLLEWRGWRIGGIEDGKTLFRNKVTFNYVSFVLQAPSPALFISSAPCAPHKST